MRTVWTAGNRSMGGRLYPFVAARLANRTQAGLENPGSGSIMSPNAMLNVATDTTLRSTCAGISSYRDSRWVPNSTLNEERGVGRGDKVKIGGSREIPSGVSEGPKGSSAQLATPPGIGVIERAKEWPGQKELGIGLRTTRLVKRKRTSTDPE
nr:hypothetical protein SETIT_J011500v2 [Ipomoea batatas]